MNCAFISLNFMQTLPHVHLSRAIEIRETTPLPNIRNMVKVRRIRAPFVSIPKSFASCQKGGGKFVFQTDAITVAHTVLANWIL